VTEQKSSALRVACRCVLTAAILAPALLGQTVSTVATFNNVGLDVQFPSPPAAEATIRVSIRRVDQTGPFRPAHPLVEISPGRFAGSIIGLDAGAAYDIRLSSSTIPAGETTTRVTTRNDAFPKPDARIVHVSPAGSDTHDGLAPTRPLATLRKALGLARPGDTIILAGGRYYEGDLDVPISGTEHAPVVVRSAPGQAAILDGTDPAFSTTWTPVSGTADLYRTPCETSPTNAYLNGGQLFHFRALKDLAAGRWKQEVGYALKDGFLYVRFPRGTSPEKHRVTIPRFTTGLTLTRRAHVHIIGLEFCYYGAGTYHRGIHLERSDHVLIDRCSFHHTGVGVTLKRDADFNTIQNCSFTESPITTWSWHAVKMGGIGYESGGVGIYSSDIPNTGNVIRHNAFRDMFDAAGLYTRSTDGPTTNLDFHSNLIDKCSDDGIETDGAGINNRIYSNLIRGFLTGISVAPCALGPTYIFRNLLVDWRSVGEFSGYPFKFNVRSPLSTRWVFLYHNTCVTRVPGQHGFLFKGYSKWSDIISRNNIYVGTTYALDSWSETNPVDFDFDNVFTTSGNQAIRWARTPYASRQAFSQATGQERNGMSTPPSFVAPGKNDYGLSKDSPCINRGAVLPGFNDRFHGKAPDIGAFEAPVGMSTVHYGPMPPL
jgi:hypothetical protein